jgi:predicted nucleic acid-binding protein
MSATLVDSNVLLDVITADPRWSAWSTDALAREADRGELVVNPLVYAELAAGFADMADLDAALPLDLYRREALPWDAGFLAGRCFALYRHRGGTRRSPLPDFYIGAHAAVASYRLLTRDATRYRAYFPRLEIVAP